MAEAAWKGRLAVLGQGYVGLPLAVRAANVGITVVGYEPDTSRVALLQNGHSYVEDVPSDSLTEVLRRGRYRPTSDPAELTGFDAAIITVPTPLRDSVPDLSCIREAVTTLAPFLRASSLVVLESTTYPGTTENFVADLLFDHCRLRAGEDFALAYSPERIDPGNNAFGLKNTPKLVAGIDDNSLKLAVALYSQLVDEIVTVSRPREAELAKLLENTFRHVNIALVNELAVFAADLGVDVWEAIDAAATKPFGFMKFTPGPGVGGHCLPIDPSYLSWHVRATLGRSFRFVELANDINDHMPDYVIQRLTLALNSRCQSVNGSQILLLGLSYKANTSDVRESPSVAISERLARLGARVRYVDDHVRHRDISWSAGCITPPTRAILSPDEISAADAVVVLTDHDDVDYQMVETHASYVLDTRHRCAGPIVEYL